MIAPSFPTRRSSDLLRWRTRCSGVGSASPSWFIALWASATSTATAYFRQAHILADFVTDGGCTVAALCRGDWQDRKSTRLNSSHANISYAVVCFKK